MVIAGTNPASGDHQQHQQQQQQQQQHQQHQHQRSVTITTSASIAAAAAAQQHHQQHQQQHHQQHQQQHSNHTNNNGNSNNHTIITTTTGGGGSGAGGGSAAPSNGLEHFNVTALGELSNVQLSSINAQLVGVGGTVTADGNFVTMGGVVVGRIHPASLQQQLRNNATTVTVAQPATRAELQQLGGVIKVESPPTEFNNNNEG